MRVLGLVLCAALAAPFGARAQEAAPQIVIPVTAGDQATQPGLTQTILPDTIIPAPKIAPDAADPTGDTTAIAAQPVQQSPQIQLGPNGEPIASFDPLVVVDPKIAMPTDDPSLPPPPKPVEWLMPLVPVPGQAPAGVRVGAGMSQPGILRLSGETVSVEMQISLPQGVAPSVPLVLMLRASVNNLPEESRISIEVNGTKAGDVPLQSIGPFVEQRLDIVGLMPGVNTVRLTAHQMHRIFCGPEASFGVWSEIDLSKSGVPVAPALLTLTPSGLITALLSQTAGNQAVEILADQTADDAVIRHVAQTLGTALGYTPKLAILPFYSESMSPTATARIAIIAGQESRTTIRRGTGDAVVLQIEYNANTLPDLSAVLPALDARTGVPVLAPDTTTPLSAFGVTTIIGNTHYFRKDISFLLPETWLLLASQKAEIELNYGFSDELPKGALLLVKINGKTVQLLPLDKDGGKMKPPLLIRFLANMMDPGLNTLTFEMSVPGEPSSLPCMTRDTDMLAITGETTISVPSSPMMRQNDLLGSLAELDGRNVIVPIVQAGEQTRSLGAELDFAAVLFPIIASDQGPVLHVVGIENAGLIPTGDTGITRRALQDVVDMRRAAPPAVTAMAAPAQVAPTPAAFKLSVDMQSTGTVAAPTAEEPALLTRLAGFLPSFGWVTSGMHWMLDAAFPGSQSLSSWMEGKSGLALVLQPDPENPNDLWLLAGPGITMSDLAQKLDALRRDGGQAGQVHAALLRRDGRWDTWSENRAPDLAEPLSIFNLREVLGNYASWSPFLFTTLTMIFAIFSVLPALIYVIITRRKGSRI
jgi:cellulose synthase operon protein B